MEATTTRETVGADTDADSGPSSGLTRTIVRFELTGSVLAFSLRRQRHGSQMLPGARARHRRPQGGLIAVDAPR